MSLRFFLEQAIGYAILLAVVYWWTGLPEGNVNEAAVSAGVALLMVIALGLLIFRAWRYLSRTATASPGALLYSSIGLLIALVAGYLLIHWTPRLGSFATEAASMGIRFGAAYLFVVWAWLRWIAAISAGKPRATQPSSAGVP